MKINFVFCILFFMVLLSYGQDKDIQIKDYQGKKLGSLSDYVDNSIKGIQKIDIDKYMLKVDGLVKKPASFDYKTLSDMMHIKKVITLNCVEGWKVTSLWEGIPLKELFLKVEPAKNAFNVIFYANDGYTTSLSYDYIMKNNIIIADRVNGITLPTEQGYPFILVAENKWGYKWCRWITRIELSSDLDYKGFWETMGYSTEGDLSKDY